MDDASKKILLVDDNKRFLATLVRTVRRRGFAAAAFSSLSPALEMVAASTTGPAAAIIDVYLEHGRQGFELSDLVRERFGGSIPVIMISGYQSFGFKHPYCASGDEMSHLTNDLIPVYAKPLDATVMNTFLTRAAATCRLRSSPVAFREAVVSYALQRQLTPQEATILVHLASGSTRSSLPDDLELSKDTVKSQIRNMLERCDVNGTDELIAALLKHIAGADVRSGSQHGLA